MPIRYAVAYALAAALAIPACSGGAATEHDADGDALRHDGQTDGDGLGPPPDGIDSAADGADVTPLPPVTCGDGRLDPGEECDDGNRIDGDECDWSCRSGLGTMPFGPRDPATPGLGDVVGPLPISDPPDDGCPVAATALAWNCGHYGILWAQWDCDVSRPAEAIFLRVDTSGRRVEPGWRYADGPVPSGYFDLVANADGFGLAWSGAEQGLWFVELDCLGKPRYDPIRLLDLPRPAPEEPGAAELSLVWDGENYGLFWIPRDSSTPFGFGTELRYLRVGPRGARLTDTVVAWPSPHGGLEKLEAATSGTEHLVGLADGDCPIGFDAIHGCATFLAFDRDGALLGRASQPALTGRFGIAVGWGADRFGVAFEPLVETRFGLTFATYSARAELLASPLLLTGYDLRPIVAATAVAVAWGGNGWTIAELGGRIDVRMAGVLLRIDAAGRFVDEVLFAGDDCWHWGMDPHGLELEFDGGGFGLLCSGAAGPRFARYPLDP